MNTDIKKDSKMVKVGGVTFDIPEFAPIKVAGRIEFLSSKELGTRITSFMKDMFKDYKGTSIKLENGVVQPILWFSRSSKDGRGSIEAMGINDYENNDESSAARWTQTFGRMNNMINGRNRPFKLTKEAKDILKAFAPSNNGKVEWDKHVKFRDEVPQQNYFTQNQSRETLMKVTGLDLGRILSVIHGPSDEVDFDDKNKVHNMSYDITFVQMLHPENIQLQYNSFGMLIPNDEDGVKENMLLKLTITDVNVMNDVAPMLGAYPSAGNVPMY